MSVHDTKGSDHGGERRARLISPSHDHEEPCPGDIYLMFVNESYGQLQAKDISIFARIVKDRPKQYWENVAKEPGIAYIHDWESGIDCIKNLEQRFRGGLNGQKVNFFYIVNADSWNLYLCAYHLGKEYIRHNQEQPTDQVGKGAVFNQYFMNSPTY